MFTGKNKEAFEMWYLCDCTNTIGRLGLLYDLPEIVRFVYFSQYLDSIDKMVDVKSKWADTKRDGGPILIYDLYINGDVHSPWTNRLEAWEEGFKVMDESINEGL